MSDPHCKACGFRHPLLLSCKRAALLRAKDLAKLPASEALLALATGAQHTPKPIANPVANTEPAPASVANKIANSVANAVANQVANGRRGKYADPDKRRLYMRDLMRKRRVLQSGALNIARSP